MTDMIEQVERSLDGWGFTPCSDDNPDCPGGLSCPKNLKEASIATIKAMREPTPEIIEAMKANIGPLAEMWRAGVDAALGDNK